MVVVVVVVVVRVGDGSHDGFLRSSEIPWTVGFERAALGVLLG